MVNRRSCDGERPGRRHSREFVLGGGVADGIDEDLFLNGAVTDLSDGQELSSDEDMVSVDWDILLVDGDIFLNVAAADRMNGQNLSIDTVADRMNGQNLSIDTVQDRIDWQNLSIDTVPDRIVTLPDRIVTVADRIND